MVRVSRCFNYEHCYGVNRPVVVEVRIRYIDGHVAVYEFCYPCYQQEAQDSAACRRHPNVNHLGNSREVERSVTWLTTLIRQPGNDYFEVPIR